VTLSPVIKGSLYNMVSTVCGTILSNSIDSQTEFFSWKWFRHVTIVALVLIIFNEAKYWKQWADREGARSVTILCFFTSFGIGIIMDVVFHLSHL
jgi:hypothetical protein